MASESPPMKMSKESETGFSDEDHLTWRRIFEMQKSARENMIFSIFEKGVSQLEMTSSKISDLDQVNRLLKDLTGFQGVYVKGLETGETFYQMLAQKKFPIGRFIRDKEDLNYTPEPDVVHDLYGHLPFLADKDYANFCQKFGELACEYLDRPDLLRQLERFFWFTIEFGLIKTKQGLRVFGAGIASSVRECAFALSTAPGLVSFEIDAIRKQEFRIDEMQRKLFVLENTEQLYSCLPLLRAKLNEDRKKKESP